MKLPIPCQHKRKGKKKEKGAGISFILFPKKRGERMPQGLPPSNPSSSSWRPKEGEKEIKLPGGSAARNLIYFI